jgi:hypothetical protein
VKLDLTGLRGAFGLGVAGNFAGHLEQAGEAGDFVSVDAPPEAPKGIFPWYAPGSDTFLGTFPLSSDRIVTPPSDTPLNLQIEPEVAVLFDTAYDADGRVTGLAPRALTAFNDCSIRRPGARKISDKKNWGAASKGISRSGIPVADLAPDGATATLRLACFLRRGPRTEAYGIDSPLPGYTYYGATLVDWLVDRLREQHGADDTPLEDVGALVRAAGRPTTLIVGIGATRYTDLGATTYLEPGDESLVIVYDGARHEPADVHEAVGSRLEGDILAASVLRQEVVGPTGP